MGALVRRRRAERSGAFISSGFSFTSFWIHLRLPLVPFGCLTRGMCAWSVAVDICDDADLSGSASGPGPRRAGYRAKQTTIQKQLRRWRRKASTEKTDRHTIGYFIKRGREGGSPRLAAHRSLVFRIHRNVRLHLRRLRDHASTATVVVRAGRRHPDGGPPERLLPTPQSEPPPRGLW